MKGAGIGLVALLLGVAIIFWIMFGGKGQGGGYVRQELETREKATEQINAFGGKDATGTPVAETISYSAEPVRGVIVINEVKPDSPFATKYGLMAGDKVLELGPQPVKGLVSSDAEAKDWLTDAFQRSYQIVVDRNGTKLTLPDQRQSPPTPAVTNAPAPQPQEQPQPQQPAKRHSITGDAHDLVNKIQTH
jgi:hypothetical protein